MAVPAEEDNGRTVVSISVWGANNSAVCVGRRRDLGGDIQEAQAHEESVRIARLSKQTDEKIVELMTFSGCEELLRGSQLANVLSRGGRIFTNSKGSAETYKLSEQTEQLDAFISHNWDVSRFRKVPALVCHFNFGIAVMVTGLVMMILGALSAAGVCPTVDYQRAPYPSGALCTLLVIPSFVFCLFLGQDMRVSLGMRGPCVFLDKTCIHQEDEAIKRKGIDKLGAFIRTSSQMVVLFTDLYVCKLWTVYELACFVALHPPTRMKLLPIDVSSVFLCGLGIYYFSDVVAMLVQTQSSFHFDSIVLKLTCGTLGTVLFRRWAKKKARMQTRLSTFSVRETSCACECDRPIVYANIAALMRETEVVAQDAEEDIALDAFDEIVRESLATRLLESIGHCSVGYKYCIAVEGLSQMSRFLDLFVGLHHGMPLRDLVIWGIGSLLLALAVTPLWAFATDTLVGCCLRLRGFTQVLFLVTVWTGTTTLTFAALVLEIMLSTWAKQSNLGLMAFSLVVLASWLFTWSCFAGLFRWHFTRNTLPSAAPKPVVEFLKPREDRVEAESRQKCTECSL